MLLYPPSISWFPCVRFFSLAIGTISILRIESKDYARWSCVAHSSLGARQPESQVHTLGQDRTLLPPVNVIHLSPIIANRAKEWYVHQPPFLCPCLSDRLRPDKIAKGRKWKPHGAASRAQNMTLGSHAHLNIWMYKREQESRSLASTLLLYLYCDISTTAI